MGDVMVGVLGGRMARYKDMGDGTVAPIVFIGGCETAADTAATGQQSDTAWNGSEANASVIAILKACSAQLALLASTNTKLDSILQTEKAVERRGEPWLYAATASGILSTTALTIKAAAASGFRNYVTGVQISNAGITGATVTLREKTGGAVLWRGNAPAGVAQPPIVFDTPLRPSSNTELEVVLSAAVALGVFVNIQGFAA